KNDRLSRSIQRFGVLDQPFEPRKLVSEVGTSDGIAVGKIDRRDDNAFGGRFQIAALAIRRVARQSASNFVRLFSSRQNRDAMVCALAMPDGSKAGVCDRTRRKFGVIGFELLQAYDVGARFVQPFEQTRQAPIDAVHVVSCDLHRAQRCMCCWSQHQRDASWVIPQRNRIVLELAPTYRADIQNGRLVSYSVSSEDKGADEIGRQA